MNRNPKRTNCFMYAFDKVHKDGGYICFGMSTRASKTPGGKGWNWQHLGHYDNLLQKFLSFVPPGDLKNHWRSWFAFEGDVEDGDKGYRRPMTKGEMARGIFIALPVVFVVWLAKRWYDQQTGNKS